MHAHTWEDPEILPNTDSEPGKSKSLAKGNPEETPHISDLNYHEGATLSLSLPMCLSTRTTLCFSPNKHFTCFTTFHLCGNSFLQSRRARALSLTPGLVAGIRCSHRRDPTSISGRELKPCLKPLQAEATQDQYYIH